MEDFDSAGVTGIVWRRIVPGREAEAEAVMREIMQCARDQEGFLGSEIFPPIPGLQDCFVVLYRFQTGRTLRGWLKLPHRAELLDKIGAFLAEPAVEFHFSHSRRPAGTASSVFAYRVRPGCEAQFQDWRRRILEAARQWEGFLGTESFDTLEAGEPEFLSVVRFDSRPRLDAWLGSEARKILIREVQGYVDNFRLRRIGSGFEGWFEFGPTAHPPARWRQGLLILSALFPVLLFVRFAVGPVFGRLPVPVALLLTLAINMGILTYLVMPIYSQRMRFWLQPGPEANWKTEAVGLAITAGLLGGTLVLFTWGIRAV
jgi:uncharacterized protein